MRICWFLSSGILLLTTVVSAGTAGEVSVNGTPIPRAESAIDSTQEITEFRSGNDTTIQLIPLSKRYGVCIIARAPVALLDAELPLGDAPSRFTVGVEDGRQFSQCLLASLWAAGRGGKRRFTYCLRCENVTAPAP